MCVCVRAFACMCLCACMCVCVCVRTCAVSTSIADVIVAEHGLLCVRSDYLGFRFVYVQLCSLVVSLLSVGIRYFRIYFF